MRDPVARLNEALSGRYRVESLLGEGGMATVYLARDVRHDRRVALKVLKPELAAVVGAERFLAEIRTTASLQHPHILPLFDSGQANGVLFYVMPYVEGESLRERLDRERQLPVDEAVTIATDIAEALDYAHRQGVVHRDIKPANILLHDGKPVVSDFGIALAVTAGGAGRLTETGLSLGTPHYMSPEQATGDTRVGPATDVYALGCVLYEMLVGEPPYTGSTPQAILGRIIAGEGVSATKQRPTVPAHVDAAVRKALEKVPADRFASAGVLAGALGDRAFRYSDGATALATMRPRRASAALVASGALAGAIVSALLVGREPTPSGGGLIRLPLLSQDEVVTSSYPSIDVATSPDGRTVAYVGLGADGVAPQIYLRPIDQLEAIPLAGAEGGVSPAYSPDGQWIAFTNPAEQPPALTRVAASGGVAETLGVLPNEVGSIVGVTWESADRLIVGTNGGNGLFRVTMGGAVESLARGQYHWPSIVEGHGVVFMDHASNEMHLATMDLATREVRSLGLEGTAPRFLSTGHLVFASPSGVLQAVAFDADALELDGSPVAFPERIAVKTIEGAGNFDVAGNGLLVYAPASGGGGVRLVRVARDGSWRAVVDLEGNPGFPRLSPEGSRVAIAVDDDLWVLDLIRGARTRVTFTGGNRFLPIWTPDGSRLTHADGVDTENRVLLTAADGSGQQDTLIPLGPRLFPTSWSRDGRLLLLTGGQIGIQRDIHMLEVASGATASFAATPYNERGGALSPDGRWVAYVSDRSGRDEIYVRPHSGPGPELTVSVEGGQEVVWSRAGDEIFYRGPSELLVVPVAREGDGLRIGQPRAVFADRYRRDISGSPGSYANYDVTPEGEFLMLAENPVSQEAALYVVLDWLTELRARVPD